MIMYILFKYIGICDEFVPLVIENSSSTLKVYILTSSIKYLLQVLYKLIAIMKLYLLY